MRLPAQDALRACQRADLLLLELHAGLLYIVRKLRAVPSDIEDVYLHSALPRGRNPPRGVNLTTESKKGAKPSLRSEVVPVSKPACIRRFPRMPGMRGRACAGSAQRCCRSGRAGCSGTGGEDCSGTSGVGGASP